MEINGNKSRYCQHISTYFNIFQIIQFEIMKQKITIIIISLLTGLFIGWLVFHPSQKTEEKHDHSDRSCPRYDMDMCNAPSDKNGEAR